MSRALAIAVVALGLTLAGSLAAGRPAAADPARTPSTAGAPALGVLPTARGCPSRAVPPPAVDASESPRPGQPAPAPLPVPDPPVGGPRMAECAEILPPGAPPPPVGTAASWLLADLDSGQVLAARDPHARQRPASALKVLTALVVLRRLGPDTVVEGTWEDTGVPGSRVGIGPGGRYTVRQLLTGLILNSGNDAANALARQLGGVPATLAAMSATAAELGALDTRPASPSGLDAPGMSTSAYDLAVLYRVAMRDPLFAEVNRTRQVAWPGWGSKPGFLVTSDNRLLTGYPGAIGGKTGFTDDARHTMIAAAQRSGRRLVAVLLRGEQRPERMSVQAARLLDYGFALDPGSPPVGALVDRRPPDPAPGPAADRPPGSAGRPDEPGEPDGPGPGEPGRPGGPDAAGGPGGFAPAEAEPEHRLAGFLVIGGGALLGALLSVLIAQRRPSGRRTEGTPLDSPPPPPLADAPTERIAVVPEPADPPPARPPPNRGPGAHHPPS